MTFTHVSKILYRNSLNTIHALSDKSRVNNLVGDICNNLITMPLFQTLNDSYFSLRLTDISINSLNQNDPSGAKQIYINNNGGDYFDIKDESLDLLTNFSNFSFNNTVKEKSFKVTFDVYSEYVISEDFILRLSRRVRTLTQIYFEKAHPFGSSNIIDVWGSELPEIKFLLLLQRNPRRSTKNIGLEGLAELKATKCFNCSSGLTSKENNYHVGLYRENEIFGLLTHELMHFCNLDGTNAGQTKIKDNDNYIFNNTEILANSIGTVFHSIFNAFEMGADKSIQSKYSGFKILLLIEITHSFNQLARLSRILGYRTWDEFKSQTITYGYDSWYMFSYILGRALFLLNLNTIFTTCTLNLSPEGLIYDENNNDQCLQNILKRTMETPNDNDAFLNEIFTIVNTYLDSGNDDGNEFCGNMIMEYFAIDLGNSDKDSGYNNLLNLYGGQPDKYYLKYLKYKAKYLKLKNNN
jgi:hypothetical protein